MLIRAASGVLSLSKCHSGDGVYFRTTFIAYFSFVLRGLILAHYKGKIKSVFP